MKIVSVCACTVGIAHTFMAKSAIEEEAKKRGWDYKVEAQGGYGIEDELDDDDVDSADFVLLAVAVGITGDERFDEKRSEGKVITMDPSDVLKDVPGIFDRIANACGEVAEVPAKAAAKEETKEVASTSSAPVETAPATVTTTSPPALLW